MISPIIIHLKANGIRLQFDPEMQYLRLIEVLEWGKAKLTYKSTDLGGHSPPSFGQIYHKVFGPTYPGVFNENTNIYTLSYPGIAFNFKIPPNSGIKKGFEGFIKYLSQASAPCCDCFAVFLGSNWSSACDSLFVNDELKIHADLGLKSETTPREVSHITWDKSSDKSRLSLSISFLIHPSLKTTDTYKCMMGVWTPQSAIITLGPPDERLFKEDSRLSIHNPQNPDDVNADLFFNYFRYGFDICFDTLLDPPKMKKIILHGNLPGSLSFQKYKRCRWVHESVNSESDLQDLSQEFSFKNGAMFLNKQLESPSNSMEFIGGHDGSHISQSSAAEEWGQTELYGTEHCVFEILRANDLVSSVTLF